MVKIIQLCSKGFENKASIEYLIELSLNWNDKLIKIMSTASLRKDHDLIEKVLRAMWATIPLLQSGKKIPEPIIAQDID